MRNNRQLSYNVIYKFFSNAATQNKVKQNFPITFSITTSEWRNIMVVNVEVIQLLYNFDLLKLDRIFAINCICQIEINLKLFA